MAKNLVIVESPQRQNNREIFRGFSSGVQLRTYRLAIQRNCVDVENGFKPKYEVSADKSIGY
jgi:DNA topoisomerase-1